MQKVGFLITRPRTTSIFSNNSKFSDRYVLKNSADQVQTGSSIGSDAAWDANGTKIDHRIWHILSLRFGHENISTAILPLPLIQEEQLSVNDKRMYVKCWLTSSRRALTRNSVVKITDHLDMTSAVYSECRGRDKVHI